MSQQQFISILLAIVAFVGGLMVQQLMKIATAVQKIHSDLKVLTNDHTHLKEEVKEVKQRVSILEK
jgi:outer membrane murein-binding lipoprotein Lpp